VRREGSGREDTPPLWLKIVLGLAAVAMAGAVAGIVHEQLMPHPETAPDTLSDDPKPGDILLFYRPWRGRDYFIRWVTRSPFYHTAIYAGNGTVIEARPKGVSHNDLRGREDAYLVIPAPENKGEAALAWAKTRIGDPYDPLDGLVIGLEHVFVRWHINYTPPGRYTCAGFVTAAFEQAGFIPFPGRDYHDIAPADWACYLPAPYAEKYAPS